MHHFSGLPTSQRETVYWVPVPQAAVYWGPQHRLLGIRTTVYWVQIPKAPSIG